MHGPERLGQGGISADWKEVADLADKMKETPPSVEIAVREEASVEIEQNLEPEKIRQMRESWGDFDAAKAAGIFGEKTEMNSYDYGVLAQSLSWEDFASLADQAYDLGHKSYEEYEDFLFQKGDVLYKEADLSDWRQLGLAVRRYNVAKYFGEIEPGARWHTAVSMAELESRSFDQALRRMGGKLLPLQLEKPGVLHENNLGKVDLILKRDLMNDDQFDVNGGEIGIRAVPDQDVEMAVTDNYAALNRVDRYRKPHEPFQLITRQELERGIISESWREDELGKLIDDAVVNVDRDKVAEYVDRFLEQVDAGKLSELAQSIKNDHFRGAKEAINYFAKILGLEFPPELELLSKAKTENYNSDIAGAQSGVTPSNMRIKVKERDLKRSPKEALDTIAHESMHVGQKVLVYKWVHGELSDPDEIRRAELYDFCKSNYEITSQSHKLYRHQLTEEEAWNFGIGVRKMLQRDNIFDRVFHRHN